MKQHPIGKLLPAMSPEEYEYLKADIKANGQDQEILLLDGEVLDGWHRYRICLDLKIRPRFKALPKGTDALALVISNNLARRHLSAGQRYGVLLIISEKFGAMRDSLKAIEVKARKKMKAGKAMPHGEARVRSSEVKGKLCGVGHATVERVERLRRLSPTLFEKMVAGHESLVHCVHQATSLARRRRQTEQMPRPDHDSRITLIEGDFRTGATKLPDHSIQLVLADPPWAEDHYHLWAEIGKTAKKLLKPDGVLVAYLGNLGLGHIAAALAPHLKIHWPFAVMHKEITPVKNAGKLHSRWCLVLACHRHDGKFQPPLFPIDVVKPDVEKIYPGLAIGPYPKERDRHRWQRPLAEYLYFVKYLTRPGDHVVDLTGGSFASGLAAKLLGRNYVGFDIDPAAVASGKKWIDEEWSTFLANKPK